MSTSRSKQFHTSFYRPKDQNENSPQWEGHHEVRLKDFHPGTTTTDGAENSLKEEKQE